MGKPEDKGDLKGRMQIGWLLRALTDAEEDRRWRYAADFEGAPILRPLALADGKRSSHRFATGPGKSLQGRHRALDPIVWNELVTAIDARNTGFAQALSDPDAINELFADGPLGVDDDGSLETDYEGPGRIWRSERLLQDEIADLIDEERWSQPFDPTEVGLDWPSQHGYYLPATGWFADELLQLSQKHLVVVEYELCAHGDPRHGAQQAHDYMAELAQLRRLRDWKLDAAVIAEDFDPEELGVSARLGVECLLAGEDEDGETTLRHVGAVRGAIWQARHSAGLI
jgi:hypothetical protein